MAPMNHEASGTVAGMFSLFGNLPRQKVALLCYWFATGIPGRGTIRARLLESGPHLIRANGQG